MKVLFEHIDRFLKVFLLIFVLLLDFGVHFDLCHGLTAEFVLKLCCMSDQLLLILDELSGLIQGIFKRFYTVTLKGDAGSLVCNFSFELFFILEENCYELRESSVE